MAQAYGKICGRCSGDFWYKRPKSGRLDCKPCGDKDKRKWEKDNPMKVRRAHWKRMGMDPDEAEAELKNFPGHCMLCDDTVPGRKNRDWNVDHNKKTGKVRGILCSVCNVGLGMFKENTAVMYRAITYLEKNL